MTGKVVDWENGETMDQMTDSFGAWDYTVFGILLAMSSAIGIYFAWKDRQNKDEKNYALGGQKFSAWPVALSLTATSISAVTMMGSPSEYYVYGSTMAWGLIAELVGSDKNIRSDFTSKDSDFYLKQGCAFAAWIYVPVYYNLGVTSINEYIDLRFGNMTRLVMTIIALIQARVQTSHETFILYDNARII